MSALFRALHKEKNGEGTINQWLNGLGVTFLIEFTKNMLN